MSEQISNSILLAEQKWKLLLEQEVESLFSEIWLPSHDLSHHKRVWFFTKELLLEFNKLNPEFTEAAIIAAYMHDTGLTETLKPEHGEISSRMTERFLEKHPLENPVYKEELLEAIIRHDNKNYSGRTQSVASPGLYEILTTADDMDAMGALGLYRYFEIYAMRNLPVETICQAIEKNLKQRFEFLSSQFATKRELSSQNKIRYDTAINILKTLNSTEISFLKKCIDSKENIPNFSDDVLKDYPTLHHFILKIRCEEKQFTDK